MTHQKIKILPENTTNKIAAGEVVQRPESVVKELMENALDAEASIVEVYIKRAGKSLIQVVDDGIGMSEEDVEICIHRHATSKIIDYKDLDAISTFGFRGEALSSIASVSQFEINTEQRDEEIGTSIKNDDRLTIVKEKGSFPKGTSVAVKNLFYNTPARRNFLKSNATELKHIVETFKRISLSQNETSFKLFNDDNLIYDFPAATREERVQAVIADNILDAVVELKEETNFISVTGYAAKPTFLSKSRADQYLFINGRYVQSKVISHAVYSAYENVLEKGQYPFYLIYLTLNPSKVDVNVHPTKLEVKFEDEKTIYSLIHAVVKKGLGTYDLVPTMSFNERNVEREKLNIQKFSRSNKDDFSDRPSFGRSYKSDEGIYNSDDIEMLFSTLNEEIKKNSPASPVSNPFEEIPKEVYHERNADITAQSGEKLESAFIVLLHKKYILTQIKSGLMIIDSHVAHERILYEKALKALEADMPFSQQLLFSHTVKVDLGDYEILKEIEPHLNKLGFEIKFLEKNTIKITGVPSDVKIGTEVNTIHEIIDEYRKNQLEKKLEVQDNIAKSYSCKAAIKAGDKLNEQEMRLLVDQLFATSMPYVCPHGRPIVVKIPLLELDRRFERT
ncbi:MAG: DNA mismatch repair endonuclease MutL [Ignavibacteriae bacterium]|nr:DNA mismatch repair endonuclease MutL [Ignavibacteriota bacterium]NOG98754.1 DNA mismatch repair endonuclease MutL [Ignavibacteriota bacterium]